jgi:hypothetical protein
MVTEYATLILEGDDRGRIDTLRRRRLRRAAKGRLVGTELAGFVAVLTEYEQHTYAGYISAQEAAALEDSLTGSN